MELWHEPEDDIERGGFTAEQYRAAWAHLDALETAVRNKNLRSTLILMCWTLENGSNRDWHNYYVPGAIEMMGWDCYNAGYKNGNYRTPEKMYAQVLEIATETALPFGLSEFGSVIAVGDDDGAARADWLDRKLGLPRRQRREVRHLLRLQHRRRVQAQRRELQGRLGPFGGQQLPHPLTHTPAQPHSTEVPA